MHILKRSATLAITLAAAVAIHAQAPQPAPAFSAKDANGGTHSLSQYKGKIVVLEFTNPGSPVTGKDGCPFVIPRYEKKMIQNLATQVQGAGGVFLSVNSAHYNTAEDSKAVAEKYGVAHPTLIDSDGTIARAYKAKTSPHMYVINKEGNIVYQGALNDNKTPDVTKDGTATNYVMDAVKAANEGKAPQVAQTQPYGCGLKLK